MNGYHGQGKRKTNWKHQCGRTDVKETESLEERNGALVKIRMLGSVITIPMRVCGFVANVCY